MSEVALKAGRRSEELAQQAAERLRVTGLEVASLVLDSNPKSVIVDHARSEGQIGFTFMFDDRFVTALASELAAKILPQIERSNGKSKTSPRLLSVKDAAQHIGRSDQAVQHLIHRRELVVARKGRRVHLDRADLDRWIEANKI